jgi:hypothetical protein
VEVSGGAGCRGAKVPGPAPATVDNRAAVPYE